MALFKGSHGQVNIIHPGPQQAVFRLQESTKILYVLQCDKMMGYKLAQFDPKLPKMWPQRFLLRTVPY